MSVFRNLLMGINSEEPTEYTLLKSINSSATQYIDTGIIGSSEIEVEIDMSFINVARQNVLGSRYNWGTNRFAFMLNESTTDENNVYFYKGSGKYPYIPHSAVFLMERHIYKMNMVGFYIDGVYQDLKDPEPPAYTTNNSMYIFWTHDTQSTFNYNQKASIKLYGCKIRQNGELVRDYIPVLDTNNIPCLFDKISSTYFYNQGTGTFTYDLL